MKTKIRTFIGLVALGMIGFTNMNATAGDYVTNAKAVAEVKESFILKARIQENNLLTENKENKAETSKTDQTPKVEPIRTEEDFYKAAESLTASTSDEEINKYAEKQVALEEVRKSK